MRKWLALLIAAIVIFINPGSAKGAKSLIEEGKKVKFEYTLTVEGQVVDSSTGRDPLEYTHGEGMIIPGLEAQLKGMKVGQKKNITVQPDQAYGPIDSKAIVSFPKENINADAEPQQGMVVQFQTNEGQMLTATIVEIQEETVTLDFNHPLAGKELHFAVEVVEIE